MPTAPSPSDRPTLRGPQRSLSLAVAVAAGVALFASACGLLPQEPSPLVAGSQWRIVAVDGVRTPGEELLLTFIGDSATLSSQCGAGVSEVVAAAEGPALEFGPFDGPAEGAPCPPQTMELHERLARALESVDRWQRVGSVTELMGESVIRIEPQHTDT